MDLTFWGALVHEHTPHTRTALYVAAALAGASGIAAVFARACYTRSHRHLLNGWLVRTASQAAPIPIYIILLLAPLDTDLIDVMKSDQIVVAIAGFYGLVETLKDIRGTAAHARQRKIGTRQ